MKKIWDFFSPIFFKKKKKNEKFICDEIFERKITDQ